MISSPSVVYFKDPPRTIIVADVL